MFKVNNKDTKTTPTHAEVRFQVFLQLTYVKVCDVCHDMTQKCMSFSGVAFVTMEFIFGS